MTGFVDMHCHIIPYVDDGANDMEEAIKMLNLEYAEGVRTIIATPHFRFKMFETPREEIIKQFLKLREAAKTIGEEGIRMYLGCELHSNMDMVDLLREKKVSTMGQSRFVLLELSGGAEPRYIRERVYALVAAGYKPILAHVERIEKIRKDIGFLEELVDMGARVQVNTESITGDFSTRRFCKKLMKEDFLHFVGTDCHGKDYRVPKMKDAYNYVAKKFGEDYANSIFIENPLRIIK